VPLEELSLENYRDFLYKTFELHTINDMSGLVKFNNLTKDKNRIYVQSDSFDSKQFVDSKNKYTKVNDIVMEKLNLVNAATENIQNNEDKLLIDKNTNKHKILVD